MRTRVFFLVVYAQSVPCADVVFAMWCDGCIDSCFVCQSCVGSTSIGPQECDAESIELERFAYVDDFAMCVRVTKHCGQDLSFCNAHGIHVLVAQDETEAMLHVRADDLRQLTTKNVFCIPLVDVVDLHDVRHLDTKAKRTGAFVQELAARTLLARTAEQSLRRFPLDRRVVSDRTRSQLARVCGWCVVLFVSSPGCVLWKRPFLCFGRWKPTSRHGVDILFRVAMERCAATVCGFTECCA